MKKKIEAKGGGSQRKNGQLKCDKQTKGFFDETFPLINKSQ